MEPMTADQFVHKALLDELYRLSIVGTENQREYARRWRENTPNPTEKQLRAIYNIIQNMDRITPTTVSDLGTYENTPELQEFLTQATPGWSK